jgi:two-component system cell cycle sensor histidine kinase/response regulator CckA
MKARQRSPFLVGIIGLSALLFIMDLLFPLGIIVGVLYLPIVMASLRFADQHRVMYVATGCSMLTVTGFFLAPSIIPLGWELCNRALGLVVIWLTAIVGLTTRRLAAANTRLERELSEGKETERRLRESEKQWRLAAKAARFGTYDFDPRTGQSVWSADLWAIHGLAEEEGIALERILTLIHPEDRERFRRMMTEVLDPNGSGDYRNEARIVRSDGEVRWVCDTGKTFFAEEGGTRRAVRAIGIVRDITDQKRAEKQLLTLNAELEQRVVQRTSELTTLNTELVRSLAEREKLEDDLRQARKMEAIGTLAGGIAHDFNNILAIILGYARESLGEDTQDAGPLSRNLQAIVSAGERGAKVVRQLLTFARKTPRHDGPVDINVQLRQLIDTMTELFPKKITYSVNLDPIFPLVWGDRFELQQVLINLCINARDAMPDGGRLSILTSKIAGRSLRDRYPEAQDDLYVRIDVADTGTGMDEETQRHIFEPFFTTKRETGGTGLGLAVVYGIIQGHGGFVEVESDQGQGSRFSIFLPARLDLSEDFDLKKEDRSEVLGGSETIFVVEDEAQIRQLLKSLLEKKGYQVLTAQDGEEAIQVYQKHKEEITLVLLDIGLPGLGGRELHLRLKQLGSPVKVVVLSGYLDPGIRDEMLKEGVDAFLQKPCMAHEILKTIADILGKTSDLANHGSEKEIDPLTANISA